MIFENAARVYPDYKQNCARLGSFPYKHPSNNYCCNPHMSGSFLELLLLFFNQCWYPAVSLCSCWSLQVTFPSFSRFQRMSWKCWAGFHSLMIILAVLTAKILWRVETGEKIIQIVNHYLPFFTNGKIYPRLMRTQNKDNCNCEMGND